MQVFVPYKEVLQLYEKGLKVPDYVTLMWCDDNYGYMTRLSDTKSNNDLAVAACIITSPIGDVHTTIFG